jgi:hypothetical protein
MNESNTQRKTGPRETTHTLAPLTFDEALTRLLAAKPRPRKPKKPRRKKAG